MILLAQIAFSIHNKGPSIKTIMQSFTLLFQSCGNPSLGKTAGFCTDAPAGPSRQKRPLPYRDGDCPRLREAPESQRDEERHEENTRGIITIFQKPTLQRMSPPRGEREGTLNETRL